MTDEDIQKIDAAELAIQKAYEGKGDLIDALTKCRLVYVQTGVSDNRQSIIESSIKVLNLLKNGLFKTEEQRKAARESAVAEAAAVEEEETKQRLYDEHMAKSKKKKS